MYGFLPVEKQQLFLDALKHEKVYFRTVSMRDTEIIVYKINETTKFYGIKREIMYGKDLDSSIEEAIPLGGKKR